MRFQGSEISRLVFFPFFYSMVTNYKKTVRPLKHLLHLLTRVRGRFLQFRNSPLLTNFLCYNRDG